MVSSLSFGSPVKDVPAAIIFERARLRLSLDGCECGGRTAAFRRGAKTNEQKVEASVCRANWQSCQSMLAGARSERYLLIRTAETDSYGNGFPVISIGARSSSYG